MSIPSKISPEAFKAAKAEAAALSNQQVAFDFWTRTIEAGQQAKAQQPPQQSPRLNSKVDACG